MQGDPTSMLYFGFHNAPLIKIASSDDKLSAGCIDNTMMLATRHTLDHCYEKLKDMMEWPGGGFNWSLTHNLPFKLSKTGLMNFPRSFRDPIPNGLRLDRTNSDGSVTLSLTQLVSSSVATVAMDIFQIN